MVGSFDYNNDDVMNILNNPNLNDEQKKVLFERYKSDLKETRRKEIITRLNECAKNNPIITQEEYVNFLKQYNDDDLSKPFEVIEKELESFSREMQDKYNDYLERKAAEERTTTVVEEEVAPEVESEETDDDIMPDVTPVNYNTTEIAKSLFDSEAETENEITPTVFEDTGVKEVMPEDLSGSMDEKGNASAVIISIIAIIVGMVIMYSIIKLK